MDGERTFEFLAHYVETWNWLLPFTDELNKDPSLSKRYRLWFPLCWLMSFRCLLSGKPFTVVDLFTFKGNNGHLHGRTTLLNNFGYHFFLKGYRGKIRQRILDAVLHAQSEGMDVIGLGALTKAEWLTGGGGTLLKNWGTGSRYRSFMAIP